MSFASKLGIPAFKVVSHDDVQKMKLAPTDYGIINLDRSGGGGTHWVCYANDPNLKTVFYGDSYGLPPSDIIAKFLKSAGKPVMYNDGEIQSIDSIMCGYFCLYFLDKIHRQKDPAKMLKAFKEEPEMMNEKLIRKFGGALSRTKDGARALPAGAGEITEGITTGTTILGQITDKILPGSSVVLDFFGKMLGENIEKIIDQKDKSERTNLLRSHYNKILRSRQLGNLEKAELLNIVRQMYNKNLTQEQKAKFLADYAKIASKAKDVPKGILKGSGTVTGVDPEKVVKVAAPADLWTLKEIKRYSQTNVVNKQKKPLVSGISGGEHVIVYDQNPGKTRKLAVLSPDSRPLEVTLKR